MTTILEAIDGAAEQKAAATTKARASYWTIVRRHGKPAGGDGQKLIGVMETLGLDKGDVERDIAAVDHVRELERVAAGREKLEADAQAKSKAFTRIHEEWEELARQRGPALSASEQAQAAAYKAVQAVRQVEKLRTDRPELFGS